MFRRLWIFFIVLLGLVPSSLDAFVTAHKSQSRQPVRAGATPAKSVPPVKATTGAAPSQASTSGQDFFSQQDIDAALQSLERGEKPDLAWYDYLLCASLGAGAGYCLGAESVIFSPLPFLCYIGGLSFAGKLAKDGVRKVICLTLLYVTSVLGGASSKVLVTDSDEFNKAKAEGKLPQYILGFLKGNKIKAMTLPELAKTIVCQVLPMCGMAVGGVQLLTSLGQMYKTLFGGGAVPGYPSMPGADGGLF